MSLKKKIPAPSGAVAQYWRIAGILFNEAGRVLEIHLAGYIDEATRRAVNEDGSPKFTELCAASQRLTPEQWKEMFADHSPDIPSKATLYEFLKTLSDWKDAADA